MRYFTDMMQSLKDSQETGCRRCGNCCKQGGPALHGQDLQLFDKEWLRFKDLITVRRGELAIQPLIDRPQPVLREFVKIKGQGRDWCCFFYDHAAEGCSIYGHRPVACGLLDCKQPEALLAIAGKDLLSRFDLIPPDDPLLRLVQLHDEKCPCPDLSSLGSQLVSAGEGVLMELTQQVNLDLAVRGQAAREFALSLDLELFYFGRPLFQLLQPLGVVAHETMQGLRLEYCP